MRFHDGVDIASNCGDNVRAAHDGTVLAAGRQYDDYMGWTSSLKPYYNLLDTKHWWNSLPIVIVIDDGDGYRSIYAHEYQVLVKPGPDGLGFCDRSMLGKRTTAVLELGDGCVLGLQVEQAELGRSGSLHLGPPEVVNTDSSG